MKQETVTCTYWCHSCRSEFTSQLQPGQVDILCPHCNHDCCQLTKNSSQIKQFEPYQKPPTKKENRLLKLGQRVNTVNLLLLQQIMEEQQHQNQGIQMTPQQLTLYRKALQRDSQCSVCREDLKQGQRHLVFGCKHAFHQECLIDWLRIKNSCPTCRQKMIPEDQG